MLSVIIPALNAGKDLASCLAVLGRADEIVLVDGGSSDATVAIAERSGVQVIDAPRGRGAQMHAGATAALGDWLLFLHADTRLSDDWPEAVAAHIAGEPDCAAFFAFRLDDPAWQARLIEKGVALRSRLFGLPYGDQAMLISRRHYYALGGFRPLALMEDVDLTRRIGPRRLRCLNASALTSAERWRRDGWVRRSGRNLLCLTLYSLGVAPARIATLYR